MKIIILFLLGFLLCSCGPAQNAPQTSLGIAPGPIEQGPNGRFTITLMNTFYDRLAYGNERGIYLIKDTQTGTEYIGVSGVGISEVGSHRNGKTTYRDER